MTLMEFILNLLNDDSARQDFADNPDQALHDAGLGNLSADDVRDAIDLMQDNSSQDADFSRNYGGDHEVNIAAPQPVEHHDGGGSESAAEYINKYITNNYVTNEGDHITDNSINQQIDNRGGNFDQDIDNHSVNASGDGAVAAGGDIDHSNIATGDGNTIGDGNTNVDGEGNTVGDGNVSGHDNTVGDGNSSTSVTADHGGSAIVGDGNASVQGDGNTTGFGSGDVSSTNVDGDVNLDHGSSFAIGGDSSSDSSDHSTHETSVDNSDNSTHDSGNTTTDWQDNSDSSSHSSYDDSSSHSNYEDNSDRSYSEDNDTESHDSHDHSDSDVSFHH